MKILLVLILVGAIQGSISAVLLFISTRGNRLSNVLLAGILLFISMACFNLYLMNTGFRYTSSFAHDLAYVLPLIIVMPTGPLLYFYSRSLLQPDLTMTRKDWIHFYPVVIDLLPYVASLLFFAALGLGWIHRKDEAWLNSFTDVYQVYADIPRWLSLSIYLYLAWTEWSARKKNTKGFADVWLREFFIAFICFQAIWFIHLVPYLIPASRDAWISLVDWYPIYIPLVILVYWLGINGYILNRDQSHKTSVSKANLIQLLPKEQVADTIQVLYRVMEIDRLFLDPEFSLDKLVKHTGIQQKVISGVLNQHIGKSFNEFVNDFRVDELKKRLLDPRNSHLTIMGIALECGFNSQATMQRTFKQSTRLSPKEFQAIHSQQKEKSSLKTAQI